MSAIPDPTTLTAAALDAPRVIKALLAGEAPPNPLPEMGGWSPIYQELAEAYHYDGPDEVRRVWEVLTRARPDLTRLVEDGQAAEYLAEGFPTPAWPTLEHAALYGLAGDIVRIIEPETEADPVAILVDLLLAFGNVIGRAPHCVVEADYHAMNEFAVKVGVTSKGRKGSAWGHARALYERVDEGWAKERIQGGLSSGEGLIWAVRDPIIKREPTREKGRRTGEYEDVIVDPGVEDKRLFIQEDEFATVLKMLTREGNTLSDTVRKAWDKGDLRAMTKNSPAKASGAHISIVGHTTKQELLRYLSATEAGNGFGNRFLWVCVRRSKALPEGGNLQAADLNRVVARLKRAIDGARQCGQLTRDDDTRAIWRAVYPELSEGRPGLLGAMISRAEAHVLRLSGIYALLDGSAVVRAPHLRAALALWEYCEDSARFIFGDALGDPLADEILRLLRNNPNGLSRTEVSNHFGRHKDAHRLSRAFSVLLEHGLVTCERRETDGRAAEVWHAIGSAKKPN